jgi:tetratricopeptide (TPR) repeat protein
MRRALAENYRVLGNIYSQANDFESAARDLGEALRLYEGEAAASSYDAEVQIALAQTMHDLGRHHSNSSRYAGALGPFEQAIAVAERARLARPDDADLLRLIGDTHAQYGLALSWEGRQQEGEAEMARAAAIYAPLMARDPNDVPSRNGLWSVYWLTSSVYEEQDDARSHEFALKALAEIRHIVDRDAANIRARQQLAKSYSRLGQTATNTGRATEAIGYLRDACGILDEIAAGESRNGRLRSELALALTRLADARAQLGRLREALADAERAAGIYSGLIEAFPNDRRSVRNLVLTHQSIGDIYDRLSRAEPAAAPRHRDRAAANHRRALDLLQRLKTQEVLAEADARLVDALEAKVAQYGGGGR